MPDSPHACAVSLPTWDSVVGYEEGRDKVLKKLEILKQLTLLPYLILQELPVVQPPIYQLHR